MFDRELLNRFESLGDNCEFGFFQRHCNYERGSLFRWALIQDPKYLLNCIRNDFSSFYEFENLAPTYTNMLIDKQYNLIFHTELFSHQEEGGWCFDDSESERLIKYQKELEKIKYLVAKFKSEMKSGNKVYVLKRNNNEFDMGVIEQLATEMNKIGPSTLLVVLKSDNSQIIGTTKNYSENVLISYIDRFADYSRADDISVHGWNMVISSTLANL